MACALAIAARARVGEYDPRRSRLQSPIVDGERAGFRPGNPLVGTISLPPSKSLAQRALLIAGMSARPVWIGRLGREPAADLCAALALVRGMGALVDQALPGSWRVQGRAPGRLCAGAPPIVLDLGESGTLARLATAAIAYGAWPGRAVELRPAGTLRRRGSKALFQTLSASGVGVEFLEREHAWPVRLRPLAPPSSLRLEQPTSSQELSALLIAAAAWPDEIEIEVVGRVPSLPYVAMTRRLLTEFGATIDGDCLADGGTLRVRGPIRAPKTPLLLEPDASAAAVALAAACISDGDLRVEGLNGDSIQGDVRIVEHLLAFGCRAGIENGALRAGGRPSRGAELDLGGEPDLAPVLAAVAAQAARLHGARTRLSGLASLRGKESPRVTVLAEGLAALGLSVIADDCSLEIAPGRPTAHALLLDPRDDHRMAFAFALLGLIREDIDVLSPGCVAKSWPGFWSDFSTAGVRVAPDVRL